MPLYNFVDGTGPVIPAAYLNALDAVRLAVSASANGEVAIARPTSGLALTLQPIGTTDALGIFSQGGGSNVASINLYATGFTSYKIQARNVAGVNFALRDDTAGVDRLTLDDAGAFIFGKPSAGRTLTVNQIAGTTLDGLRVAAVSGTGNYASINLYAAGAREYRLIADTTAGSLTVRDETGTANRLVITSAGLITVYSAEAAGLVRVGYLDMLPGTWNSNTTQTVLHSGTIQRYTGSGGHAWTTYTSTYNGETVTLLNNGSGTFTISCAGTLRWFTGAAATDGSPRTVAVGGSCTLVSFGSGANNWMLIRPLGIT